MVDAVSLDDESLDIQVSTYRSFVNNHPRQTTYFQPILDRLNIVPSRFDIREAGVVVEGKSDYFALRYAAKLLGLDDLTLLPALGAGTFDALAAFHTGWNLNFLFVLDNDRQGQDEKNRYVKNYGISIKRIVTLGELVNGVRTIENLLDDDGLKIIKQVLQLSEEPSKAHLKRFFQERLASDDVIGLGEGFNTRAGTLLKNIKARLHPQDSRSG